ncbi:zinc finger protein 584-like isoform X2 [Bombina bombina]|uniref:zinc finger protein 584-like isoform X2 n=1 Tax=Bombina bombina TaxID=8345 RepID=UPI00235A5C52|nr:zinc finger protein 584-like isoform X2 [Bombina bombina]
MTTEKNQTSEIFTLTREEQMEFDEVAVYFSEEEWGCLTEEQKELYKDVMMENYQILSSLGYDHVKPLLVTKIERREELYVSSFPVTKVYAREEPLDDTLEENRTCQSIPLAGLCLEDIRKKLDNIKVNSQTAIILVMDRVEILLSIFFKIKEIRWEMYVLYVGNVLSGNLF